MHTRRNPKGSLRTLIKCVNRISKKLRPFCSEVLQLYWKPLMHLKRFTFLNPISSDFFQFAEGGVKKPTTIIFGKTLVS